MTLKRKKSKDEIEIIDDEKTSPKEKKGKKHSVFLAITIILLLLSAGTFGYLYYKNNELNKEVKELRENVSKVEKAIESDKKEITEKEDEYEKMKEKVKENFEELEIWEGIKEELNKSLS